MTNEELAERIYSGQNELVGELYTQNRGIIYKYAKGYYNRHTERCNRCGIELDDLLNQSFFALPEAVTAYNENNTKGHTFLAFLKYPLLKSYNELTGYRTKTGTKEPLNNCTSLDAPVSSTDEADDTCFGDLLADDAADFEDKLLTDITLSGVMDAVKKTLNNDKYFDVIKRHYILNMTQTAIAKELGCNGSNVRQIIVKSLRILRKPENKLMAAYRDEIIGASYHLGGLGRFHRTNQSSVEWAVLKMEKAESHITHRTGEEQARRENILTFLTPKK